MYVCTLCTFNWSCNLFCMGGFNGCIFYFGWAMDVHNVHTFTGGGFQGCFGAVFGHFLRILGVDLHFL